MGVNELDIVFENPGTKKSNLAVPPKARPRRYHSKSRNGCFSCKKRRVKCDETKPSCLFCLERKVTCEYPFAQSSGQTTSSAASQTQDTDAVNIKDDLHRATLDLLENSNVQQKENPSYNRLDSLELIDHFTEEKSSQWLGGTVTQDICQRHGVRLALEAPYLLHSILAVAAAHLEYLYPGSSKSSVAAALHYQLSLKAFSTQLNLPLLSQDADSIFAASLLHAILAFAHSNPACVEAAGLESHYLPPWLGPLQGICTLLRTASLQDSLRQGSWSPFIDSYDDFISSQPPSPAQKLDSTTDLDDHREIEHLREICVREEGHQRDTLLEMLTNLQSLLPISHNCDHMGKYIYVIATAPPAIVHLWSIGEPTSLLVLGYWCALVSRIDQWWLVAAAKAECQRIRNHVASLEQSRFDTAIKFLSRSCDPAIAES